MSNQLLDNQIIRGSAVTTSTPIENNTRGETGNILVQAGNTLAQAGRIPGGVAKGVLKLVSFPALFVESLSSQNSRHLDYQKLEDNLNEVRSSGVMYTQEQLMNALHEGKITQAEYDNTINEWRAGNNPYDQAVKNSYVTGAPATPVTDKVNEINTKINDFTDSWVPAPQTDAAEFAANAADVVGEAVPVAALAALTGGSGAILTGTPLSYAGAFAQSYSSDWLDNEDLSSAMLSGTINAGSEWLGGKTIDVLAAKVPNEIISKGISITGEGLEENAGGFVQGVITGEGYSFEDAKKDFSLGVIAGAALNAGAKGVNFIKNEIGTQKVVNDIRAGKGNGAISGLKQSLDIAKNNPEKYGDIARSISEPAFDTNFDAARFSEYVKSAVNASGVSSVKVPKNIADINAKNVGSYETLTPVGLRNAASILEAAQVGKGLSPRLSGKILKAVVETNNNLYGELNKISGGGVEGSPVRIDRGVDYRNTLPGFEEKNNYNVIELTENRGENSEDRPINIFRGLSSEWIIPTIDSGRFVIPNPSPNTNIETNSSSLFGSGAGQMLGAGLYLTSVPSKADQYTSGVPNDISLQGRDSSGIMANSVLLGGTTYINEAELSKAERGENSDVVKMGRVGQESELASFINNVQGDAEAAAIYSKTDDVYTEIVRPTVDKTTLERVYLPTNGSVSETIQKLSEISASELGQLRAKGALEEASNKIGNADINSLLEKNIAPDITTESVVIAPSGIENGTERATRGEENKEQQIDLPLKAGAEKTAPIQNEIRLDEYSPLPNDEASRIIVAKANTVNGLQVNIEEGIAAEAEQPVSTEEIANGLGQAEKTVQKEVQEEQNATELANQIWSPAKAMMEKASQQKTEEHRRRERELPGYDFNVSVGSGSTGRIYETSGYNVTFGGLSSY